MRVCLVSYEFPPDIGGEATYTHQLARGLASLGHEVVVLVPKKRGTEYVNDGGYRMLRVGAENIPMLRVAGFLLAARQEILRLASSNALDLVHFTFDYLSLPIWTNTLRVPVVATVHHLHMDEAIESVLRGRSLRGALSLVYRGALLTLTERSLVRGADATIAVSRFTQRSLSRHMGVSRGSVAVVRDGVEDGELLTSRDSGRVRRAFGLGDLPFFLFVGRLERSKGLHFLLRAVASARAVSPGVRLVVVGRGGGRYAEELAKMAKELGLSDSVRFTGRVSRGDLVELYAASTALVLPSLMEGFGLTLLEAMAAGKPCIATRVGAVPEVVVDRETGILVDAADVPALSEAIVHLASSPGECARMGAEGRARVKKGLTVERMVEETLQVYADVKRMKGDPDRTPRAG